MWASAGHLCRCQTTQGWFFFYLTTLTAQLLSKGGLDIKMHHVSFPLPCGEQEREPSEAAHPCLPCCLSLSQSRPSWAWRACVTLQAPAVIWALMARTAEDWRALWLQNKHQVCLICYSNCFRDHASINSQQIYTKILPYRQKWRWHELVLVGLPSS